MKKIIGILLFFGITFVALADDDHAVKQTKLLMKYEMYFSDHGYEMLETYTTEYIYGTWFTKGDFQILLAWESGSFFKSKVHIHRITITPSGQSRYLSIRTKYGEKYSMYYLNPETYQKTRAEPEKKDVYPSSLHLEILDIPGFAEYSDDIKSLVEFFKQGP